jgi:poly-gamma-glutamate synthesis protein (capsule biosynthesis protein)
MTPDAAAIRLFEPEGEVRLRLAAAGDVAVIGATRAVARARGEDAVFAAVAPAWRAADVAFANLEMPVGEPGWMEPGRAPEFRLESAVPAALARAGLRVVSLANNHMMDCGARGLDATLEACARAGLATAGAGADLAAARAPARLEARGARVVVLAWSASTAGRATASRPGTSPLEAAVVREDLARWRGEADVLVASVHWGSMYVDYPPPRVLELARALAEGGADVVLGHHPHVTQGARRDGRTLTLFSLGDLVFDAGAGDVRAEVGADVRPLAGVFTVEVADRHGLAVTPFVVGGDGVPRAADAASTAALRDRLQRLSTGFEEVAARFAEESAPALLRYELHLLGTYVRQGRVGRVVRLLGALRPRHLPLLWQALSRRGRTP